MFGVLRDLVRACPGAGRARPGRRARRAVLIVLSIVGLVLGSVLGAASATAVPRLDSGQELSFAYSYSGTLTAQSCTNPARGSRFYADMWVAAADASDASFYLEQSNTLSDPFLQVLSDRATVQTQDDDGGYGLDAYLPSTTLRAGWLLAATTFSPQAFGDYTLYSSVPLTRLTRCPQVITGGGSSSSAPYRTEVRFIASTNMGLPVALTSLTPAVCNASHLSYDPNNTGSWGVRGHAIGTCTLEATQPGNGQVEAAPAVQYQLTVTPRLLGLAGLSASKEYDGSTTATLTGTPRLTGIFPGDRVVLAGGITGARYDSEHAGSRLVTIDGFELNGEDAGHYRLVNEIAGEIQQAGQEVSLQVPDLVYGEAGELSAAASSGLPVELTSLTPEVCTVAGRNLAPVAVGTCRVQAAQAGNPDHLPAEPVQASAEVARRTLTLTGLTASKRYDGSTDATVTGTPALSGVLGTDEVELAGSIEGASYDAAGAGIRTVTIRGLDLVGDQADNYRLDPGFAGEIEPSDQVVSWSDYRLVPSRSGDALPAASTSGEGALSYSVVDAGSADCSLSDGRLSFSGTGSCRLRATASQTTNNLEASTEITVTIARLGRSLGWTLDPQWAFDERGRSVPEATTDGDGEVGYSVIDPGSAGCELDGRRLSFGSAGSCLLRAAIPATTDYAAASAEIAITVTAGPPPAVGSVDVTMGLRQVAVSWSPSAHNGGAGQVGYTATAHPGGASCRTTATWCLISGLNPKTRYAFTVTAHTPAGASAPTRATGTFTAPPTIAPGAAPSGSTGDAAASVTGRDGRPVTSVPAGGVLRLGLSGFAPGSLVAIYTYSASVAVGQTTADAAGTAAVDLELPGTLEPGEHTLAAFGFGSDGRSVRAVASYRVAAPTGTGGQDRADLPAPAPSPTTTTAVPAASPSLPVESEVPVVPTPAPTPAPAPAPAGPEGPAEGWKTIGGVSYKTYDPTSPEDVRESTATMLTSLTLLSVLTATAAAGGSALAGTAAGAGGLGAAGAVGAAGVAASRRRRGTLKGVKVKHHKFRHEATAWGDRSATWVSPAVSAYDSASLSAPGRLNLWSPMVARLFGDGAYLRAIFGTWSLALQVAGVGLGVAAAASAGMVAVPPALPLVLAIVVISCLDAAAGFGAALAFGVTVALGGGLDSTDAVRSMLAICLVFFAGTLAGTAARPLRRPPSSTPADRFDRGADIVLGALIGAWGLSAMVKATSAIAGVEFPIVEHTNLIVAVFAGTLALRYLIETLAARYYPLRLAAVAPPKLGFPSPRQQIISAALRTALYLFFAYVYIGFTWYLAIGVLLFFVPSVIAAYQMKLPNLPNVVRWIPKGLIKTVLMLIVGGAFAALVKYLVPDEDLFLQVAFVALGLPGLALGLLGFFARDGETFELNWTYRLLAIPLLGLGIALATGMIILF